jgi:hypothetical protein
MTTHRITDTTPEAEPVLLEIYRAMSPARKLELVDEAIRTSRHLALMGLRMRHPDAGPAVLRRRLLGLVLGEELATRVYGPLNESANDP